MAAPWGRGWRGRSASGQTATPRPVATASPSLIEEYRMIFGATRDAVTLFMVAWALMTLVGYLVYRSSGGAEGSAVAFAIGAYTRSRKKEPVTL